MSKKKALLIAAGAYYLGSLRIPQEAKRYWPETAKGPYGDVTAVRVTKVVMVSVLMPVIVPLGHGIDLVDHDDKIKKKLRDWTEILKFKAAMAAFEDQGTRKADI